MEDSTLLGTRQSTNPRELHSQKAGFTCLPHPGWEKIEISGPVIAPFHHTGSLLKIDAAGPRSLGAQVLVPVPVVLNWLWRDGHPDSHVKCNKGACGAHFPFCRLLRISRGARFYSTRLGFGLKPRWNEWSWRKDVTCSFANFPLIVAKFQD